MKAKLNLFFLVFLFFTIGCEKEETVNFLAVNPERVDFVKNENNSSFNLETNAESWAIENPASEWLHITPISGKNKSQTITLTAGKSATDRLDTLTITAGNATPLKLVVYQPASDYLYDLNSNYDSITYVQTGNTVNVRINTDAAGWNLVSDVDWLSFSKNSGPKGYTYIDITASENAGTDPRNATITVTAENAETIYIKVVQKGDYYPNYNTSPTDPDQNGMESTAAEIAANINLGMNIGNTLEAIGGETAWGNPKITKAYIDLIKQSGFNAIRLPCSWNQYANASTAKIQDTWLNRVKEVVQYCIDDDMYVILNIHWDGGWLENNCTSDKQEENIGKQKAFWSQIATQLRDFDEHLIFAGSNEPNVENTIQMNVLKSYHQTFINAVRATGGKNTYRVLVIQGPSTDIEKTNNLMSTLPTDPTPNKLMVEVHYYTPWNFTGMTQDESWGKMFYYWGANYHSTTDLAHNPTWGEEPTVDANMALMKTKFVDNGIPVVIGEYGAMLRTNLTGDALELHRAARAFYFKYVTRKAKENGMLPFFWEAGGDGAIFNRNNNTIKDQQALDGLLEGGLK
ncbi:MAG: cellulase family glycosylhydrolase [Bacteroidales bacterium]